MSKIKDKFRRFLSENEDFRIFVTLLVVWGLSRIIMIALVPITNLICETHHDWAMSINVWDAEHYAYIIKHGYTYPTDIDAQANWAFFPLYPIICIVLRTLTLNHLSAYVTGMIVSNVCIFIAAFYTAKIFMTLGKNYGNGRLVILREDSQIFVNSNKKIVKLINKVLSKITFKRQVDKFNDKGINLVWVYAGILLFATPYAFYAGSTYTESLFIMCIALSFYNMLKKNYLGAGFFAMLTSATRIVGCILVFPIVIEMFMDWKNNESIEFSRLKEGKKVFKCLGKFIGYELKRPLDVFSVMIAPLGTFLYMLFLSIFCGDAWAFMHVQIAWRDDKYFPVIEVLWKACTGQLELRYTYMGWLCIAAFALYGYMIYRKYISMAVFGIIALLIPLTSHVMSTPRFIMGAWITYVGVYDLLARMPRIFRILITTALIVIETFMIFYWYQEFYWFM